MGYSTLSFYTLLGTGCNIVSMIFLILIFVRLGKINKK